jgi:hypothetical protein
MKIYCHTSVTPCKNLRKYWNALWLHILRKQEILYYEDYKSDPSLTFVTSKVSEWTATVPEVKVHC